VAEDYFKLSLAEQAELLQSLATIIGRRANILEKDIWLCKILEILFQLPSRKPMAFKGGTSLSKVYRVIERFSEDIDVTVDYRSLADSVPELASIISNSQRKKLSDQLKLSLIEHITQSLAPELDAALKIALPNYQISLAFSDDGEKLTVSYPSAVENFDEYLPPNILIEFGGRNSTLPQEKIKITPDVAEYVSQISWPSALVSVLSPARTFWEKATLIHVECQRSQFRSGSNRLSRHWYDLTRLADHEIGRTAIKDIALLKDVLIVKETFFRSGASNYADCLTGELRLIPDEKMFEELRQDYQAMLDAQMFYGTYLSFNEIVHRLKLLEAEINQSVGER